MRTFVCCFSFVGGVSVKEANPCKNNVPELTCSLFLLEKACSESHTITMPFYSKYSQTVIGFHDITIVSTLLRKVLTPNNQLQALFALHLYNVASSVPQNYRGTFNQISVKTTVTCQTGSSLPNRYFLSLSLKIVVAFSGRGG